MLLAAVLPDCARILSSGLPPADTLPLGFVGVAGLGAVVVLSGFAAARACLSTST